MLKNVLVNGCFYNDEVKEKRKIIEIYVTENEEEDTVSFEFERCENSEVANDTMKGLCMMFAKWKDEEDKLEIEGHEREEKENGN